MGATNPKTKYTLRLTLRKDRETKYDNYEKVVAEGVHEELIDTTLKGSDASSLAGRMAALLDATIEIEDEED